MPRVMIRPMAESLGTEGHEADDKYHEEAVKCFPPRLVGRSGQSPSSSSV